MKCPRIQFIKFHNGVDYQLCCVSKCHQETTNTTGRAALPKSISGLLPPAPSAVPFVAVSVP